MKTYSKYVELWRRQQLMQHFSRKIELPRNYIYVVTFVQWNAFVVARAQLAAVTNQYLHVQSAAYVTRNVHMYKLKSVQVEQ